MKLWIEAEVARLTNPRAGHLHQQGTPGPEGSVAKLVFAELNQRIYSYCVDMLSPEGMLFGDYTMRRPEEVFLLYGDPRHQFLRSPANSIQGHLRGPAQHPGRARPRPPRRAPPRPDLLWKYIPRS